MPKKPFSEEEVRAHREAIMDSASKVMAQVGFHHLSMRKLAGQLGMTASNIYNYFPNKEGLLLSARKRGFELFFASQHEQVKMVDSPRSALVEFATSLVVFAQNTPGYYQLMFQPPLLPISAETPELTDLKEQVSMLSVEWQQHVISLLTDAIPELSKQSDEQQKSSALFFISSLHGLIDLYYYKSLDYLLGNVGLIPEEVVSSYIDTSLQLLLKGSEKAAS